MNDPTDNRSTSYSESASTGQVKEEERSHGPPQDVERGRSRHGPLSLAEGTDAVISTDEEVLPGLPRLNYNLWNYKTKLIIVTSLLVIESSILPLALFYGLWFYTTLRHGIIFAIITSFFGIVTGIEFGLRSLKLIKKADTYRPLGGTRWRFDFTHMTLSFGYTVMTGILVGASIPHEPLVRPLAIPVPLFLIQMGIQLTWAGWMNAKNKPAPFKISSVEKGQRVPPLVLTIVEDIVAVDGAAGKKYRQNLHARYRVSPIFRRMIAGLNWFWAIGALIDGVGTMVVIWTVPQEVAYGVGKFFLRCPLRIVVY